jgi:hypothetical protein
MPLTHHKVRTHPGVETRRRWPDLPNLCETPTLIGIRALVAACADRLDPPTRSLRPAARYAESRPMFAGTRAVVRQKLPTVSLVVLASPAAEMVRIPRAPLARPTHVLAVATSKG